MKDKYNLTLTPDQFAFVIEVLAWQEQALVSLDDGILKDSFLSIIGELKELIRVETENDLSFFDEFTKKMDEIVKNKK